MNKIKKLSVRYHGRLVGTMALYQNRQVAFEYSKEWLVDGFSISPFSLPLMQRVFIPKVDPFEGLFGVFADSLPDGWGRLLVDRLLLKNHINPFEISSLDRLAIVGSSGMGALTYEPIHHFDLSNQPVDLDEIAAECANMLRTDYSDNLDDLFRLGGSSGGARPKILTKIDEIDWIIKFPSSEDVKNIGWQEYQYSLCARECGIAMAETKLFSSNTSPGYFGTRRFDRKFDESGKEKRIHMLSVSGMLETSHRIPNLDYNMLMKLTLELTKDFSEVEKMYRLMCFNVFAHNRDDHSKNFTFVYDEGKNGWLLSPAYDLTDSVSIGGEHATCVNGNGKNPGLRDILEVAKNIGIKEKKAQVIAEEIENTVAAFHLREYK
ncbi:type II toxin-antitoxin system HipA family toxin [Acetobacterium fimetarium]|uniref:Type II toxin-antitoxin system HipA family toxin n=1 Tax=Acetobacterium fimetarium TaxID=52691 RepID=A0ABR6WQM6_9FIRM|nr:type II toxin-antitoxin system HipA family toxin [Acetobacterium fimetarium]MBC3802926.1 type II toxin-antitoxin system HipA family toxin [Acetobacterium fimetarium]